MGEEISASSVFHPPSSDELEDVLSAPVEQRLVHGLRLLRQARRGNWDRADAGAFAESLFYGVVRDAGGNGSRTRDAHVGLDAGSFTRLGDAFGEWMAIDSEGSIAWLATRPIPLSSAVLEHVSAAAASGRDIDMAGWLDSFPAPIDLRTRAVWTYGGALIEALGPEQAVTELLEIPFLSPDYAFQIVTIIPGRSRD